MQAVAANQYERLIVHVPRLEAKRFRAVVKALDIEAGRVTTYASADEMCKALGI